MPKTLARVKGLGCTLILFLGCCAAAIGTEASSGAHDPSPTENESLKTFLRSSFADAIDPTTRYTAASVNLGGAARVLIVYVTGRSWCGTGGCTTLILAPRASSCKVISVVTVTRLPIRVLTTKTNGWYDISVWVEGGGIQTGYEAKLRFDGKTYPRNPTVRPAQPLRPGIAGEIVIPSEASLMPLVSGRN
jgi:hypothetical protein